MSDIEKQDIKEMILLYLQLDRQSRNVLQTGMGFLLARQNIDADQQIDMVEAEK